MGAGMACRALEATRAARGRTARQGTSVHATRNRRTESVGRAAAGCGDPLAGLAGARRGDARTAITGWLGLCSSKDSRSRRPRSGSDQIWRVAAAQGDAGAGHWIGGDSRRQAGRQAGRPSRPAKHGTMAQAGNSAPAPVLSVARACPDRSNLGRLPRLACAQTPPGCAGQRPTRHQKSVDHVVHGA